MDWRKPLFLDYFLSSKSTNKRLLSGCALALLASLLVFSLPAYLNAPASSPPLFFSRFFSAPPPTPAAALRSNLSTSSLAAGESDLGHAHLKEFPLADANNSTNPVNTPGFPHHAQETHPTATDGNRSFSGGIAVPLKTRDVNVSRADATERTHFWNAAGYDPTLRASPENDKQGKNVSGAGAGGKDDGHMQQVAGKTSSNPGIVDSVGKGANGSSSEGEARASKPQEANASRNEQDFEKTQVGSTSRDDGNSSMLAKNNQEKNASRSAGEGKAIESTPEMSGSKNGLISVQVMEELPKNCDIFNGRWVRDESMPYYPAGSCPYLDDDFNCHKNGRPDDDFLRWRWQPHGCNIPRLNATDFLERLRGKRLIFVGDSLNRNMWESLVCILRHSVKHKNKVYEASKRREFKTRGYYAFRFEDYGCSVDFVRSPFLVRELYVKNANGSYDEKLRLDLVDETTSAYKKADIVIFNTGHWWTHEKTSEGIDYYQEGNYVYPLLKVMEAYKKALKTWARWVDKNINSRRTQVFFRGYSLTHFSGGRWNSGGRCHKETEPIFNESYLSKYPSKMRVLEEVLHQKKTPVIFLNISRLTDYRKDGHPSIYRKKYASIEEQLAAEKYQDCSHWCLPGVPDTWNELLYASLLMAGKGSWKR